MEHLGRKDALACQRGDGMRGSSWTFLTEQQNERTKQPTGRAGTGESDKRNVTREAGKECGGGGSVLSRGLLSP